MISFGPIPSRRLGKSLGINNITARKTCSYSCVYCQVGLTQKLSNERQQFYHPVVIYNEVKNHLEKLDASDMPDYLTFVANGEPTLDINLGKSITLLKELNIPIAVISNASLLFSKEVREEINLADWVSVKIDAGDAESWRKINRPIKDIQFEQYKNGLLAFSEEYKGKFVTETMLVEGVNDKESILTKTAEFISKLHPDIAYISIPTRPPAVRTVMPPNEQIINMAYQVFKDAKLNTELILGFEGTNTGFTGNALEDIVNICSVHPIREETMQELLRKNCADSTILESLIHNKYIQKLVYKSQTFYIRKLRE